MGACGAMAPGKQTSQGHLTSHELHIFVVRISSFPAATIPALHPTLT